MSGKKKGVDSPLAFLPFATSALGWHKRHCTLQWSWECSCVCLHLDLCLLLQPSATLEPPGHVGLWGSTVLPTFSATAHAKVSIQTAITACVSSWTSLAVHGEPCCACLGSSCGLGVCHLFLPSAKRLWDVVCTEMQKGCCSASLLHGLSHVISLAVPWC